MIRIWGPTLLLGSSLLLTSMQTIAQTAPHFSCAGGTQSSPLTNIAIGIYANGDMVSTGLINCDPGSTPPAGLNFTGLVPANGSTVTVGSNPGNVSFAWTVSSTDLTNVSCTRSYVRNSGNAPHPSVTGWPESATSAPLTSTGTITFAGSEEPQNYTFTLACERAGVPNSAIAWNFNVSYSPVVTPPTCSTQPPPSGPLATGQLVMGQFSDPVPSGMNRTFGEHVPTSTAIIMATTGSAPAYNVTIRAMRFVAPSVASGMHKGSFVTDNDGGSSVAMGISTCPGRFPALGTNCLGQDQLAWAVQGGSHPTVGRCVLTPGETYYFNMATIDAFQASQGNISTICFDTTCQWKGGMAPQTIEPIEE